MADHPPLKVDSDAGAFEFVPVLTIRKQIQMRRIAREIWGADLDPDEEYPANYEGNLTAMLAELEAACISAPKGWRWADLGDDDMEILLEVWKDYREKRDQFRSLLGGSLSRPSEADGGESRVLVQDTVQAPAD